MQPNFMGKQYGFLPMYSGVTWLEIQNVCHKAGLKPGSFKTKEEKEALKYSFSKGYGPPVAFVGLHNNISSSEMYR